jgi:hypothetical protein
MTMQKKISVPSDLRLVYRHVRRLFEKHDLDPDNLRDWHQLLHILAPHSGPPAKWFSVTLCMLRATVEALQALNPGKSDLWCCEQISKNKNNVGPSYYDADTPYDRVFPFKGINPKTLRRKLAEARKPELQATYDAWCEGGRRDAEEV